MKTVDIEFYRLCDEIDFWKEQAEYYKLESEKWYSRYNETIQSSIRHNEKMIGNLLMFALDTDLSKLKKRLETPKLPQN